MINNNFTLLTANTDLENKLGATEKDNSDQDAKDKIDASDINNAKEVLIGGDTEDNRSARGSIRERHQVKTFSEVHNFLRHL